MALRVTRQYIDVLFGTDKVSRNIAVDGDDGFIYSVAGFDNTGAPRFGYDSTGPYADDAWFRFQDIRLGDNITIESAYLYLKASTLNYGSPELIIDGDDTDSSIAPTSHADYDGKSRTTAQVTWDFATTWVNGTFYSTPDIKSIIQEIIDRPSWASENDLTIFIRDDLGSGNNRRQVQDNTAVLIIEWSQGQEHNKTATNTLIATQDLHCSPRTPIAENSISFTDIVNATFPLRLDNSVSFSSTASANIFDFDVSHSITFSSSAYVPAVYNKTASNTIVFTDTATHTLVIDTHYVESTITFGQHADTNIKGRSIEHTLEFSQSLSYDNTIKRPIAENTIEFWMEALAGGCIRRDASNDITIDIACVNQDTGATGICHFGLHQSVWYNHEREPYNDSRIDFNHEVSYELIKASGISKSASNTITFNASTNNTGRSDCVESVISFTQTAAADLALTAYSSVDFTSIVTIEGILGRPLVSDLELTHTLGYELFRNGTICQYSPFVGGTTADLPEPPTTVEPTIVHQENIQLYYPATSEVPSLTLRGPEYGNKDKLHFQRVQRETRGGTLIIFADPLWPKTRRLNLLFTGLTESECQDTLTFVESSVGELVKLRDWEGRYWTGIITMPDNPISRDRKNCNTLSLDIEIEQARYYELSSTIVFSHVAGGVVV